MPQPFSYRRDPDVPSFPDDRPVFIFDGMCALCSGSASFVLRHDRAARLRLLPAQTALGQALYRHFGLDPATLDSVILLEAGQAYLQSEAVIRIAVLLGGPWQAAVLLRALPRPWRDAAYDLLARHRFQLFGRRDTCRRAAPEETARFLA